MHNISFNDLVISSQCLLRLFAVLSFMSSSLSICPFKTQRQKAFSLNAGLTKGVTSPTAHRGIWHGASDTKS